MAKTNKKKGKIGILGRVALFQKYYNILPPPFLTIPASRAYIMTLLRLLGGLATKKKQSSPKGVLL